LLLYVQKVPKNIIARYRVFPAVTFPELMKTFGQNLVWEGFISVGIEKIGIIVSLEEKQINLYRFLRNDLLDLKFLHNI
jgi:hypothetical protein